MAMRQVAVGLHAIHSMGLIHRDLSTNNIMITDTGTAKILDLLQRPGGATAKELLKVTGWQPHSVRGFLSGTVGKKMGLTVTSVKGDNGQRSYSVKG